MTALDRIEALMTSIREIDGTPVQAEELYYLLRNAGLSEQSSTKVILTQARLGGFTLPPITHMELFLTEACNLGCTYCFVEGKNNKNRMSLETARRSVDFLIREARDAPRVAIVFFGGEPMLEFDLIRDTVLYAEANSAGKEVKFDITSNGLLLNDERAKFLADHGVRVLLSIDGDEDTHDTYRRTIGDKPTFEKLMDRVQLLKRYQPYLGAKLTVMPEFGGVVDESVRALSERGINFFLVGQATGIGWTNEQASAFVEAQKRLYDWWRSKPRSARPFIESINEARGVDDLYARNVYGCRAGRSGIVVNCRGVVYPCAKMLGANGLTGILPLGTLDDGLTEMETRLRLCGLLPPDRPGCWSCQQQRSCAGGCYAVNYSTTGDPFKSGPECNMVAARREVERYIRSRELQDVSRVTLEPAMFA